MRVGPAIPLAEAGYLKHQLAEQGIRAWLRPLGEEAPDEVRLAVARADADRARAVLGALEDGADPGPTPERRGSARRVKRVGASFLVFMLCLRYGMRLFKSPYTAIGAGVLLGALCFLLMGEGDVHGPPSARE